MISIAGAFRLNNAYTFHIYIVPAHLCVRALVLDKG